MKYSITKSIFILISLCFCLNISVNANGHKARPGNTRKNPRKIINEYKNKKQGIIQGYYPSWVSSRRKMKDINPNVNIVYLSFAKMDLSFTSIESLISSTSLIIPTIGLEYTGINEYLNDAMELRKARPDIILILSLGGETYQPASFDAALNAVESIVNLVDQLGFDGVDIDYEPEGSFESLNKVNYAEFYVKYVKKLRDLMCDDKLISMSLSSNGALSCVGFHDPTKICMDNESPYNAEYFKNPGVNKELLRGAEMASAGGSIYLMNNLKEMVDIIFVQTFNLNSSDTSIITQLYDSYRYYGRKYGYVIIMGFNLMFSTTPFNPTDSGYVQQIGSHIKKENSSNQADGMGLWVLSSDQAVLSESEAIKNFVNALH